MHPRICHLRKIPMKNSSKNPTSLVFTSLALALTGCGGGGSGTDSNSSMPASADMIASFNSIAEYCGEETRLPAADAAPGINNRLSYTMRRGSESQDVSDIYSVKGSDAFNDVKFELKVGVDDWRGVTTLPAASGPESIVRVSRGIGAVGEGMGIQLLPSLPSGGIACVKAVSWFKAVPSFLVVPNSYAEQFPARTLFWASRDRVTLPISTLGSYPVDGFELVGNFNPASGTAFFTVPKSFVFDTSAIQICNLPNGADAWNCGLPTIRDNTDTWTFSIGAAQPGIYMLTSSHPVPNL